MKYIFWFLTAILLTGCIDSSKYETIEQQVEDLKNERDSLIWHNSQLKNKLVSITNEPDSWFDTNTEGKYLLESGIENPKEFIINSLKQQPELVPAKPVLGGQIRFTRVQLLGRDCLIACYEDGHIAGKAIYSFVLEDGRLNFSLVRKCSS